MKGKSFKKRILSLMMVFAMLLSVVAVYVVPTETALASGRKVVIAGSFDKLGNCNIPENWSNNSTNGTMEDKGNGYYYKEITFDVDSEKDRTVEFKIVFDENWDSSISNNGNNISLTIPKGTSSVKMLVNENEWKVYNSIENADVINAYFESLNDVAIAPVVSDSIQVKVDDTIYDLAVYMNGVYETKAVLNQGAHTVQLYLNGEKVNSEKTVNVSADDTTVYFRLQDGVLKNSLTNTFVHSAALTGNFYGLEFVDDNGTRFDIGNWAPADANAHLEYIGGGLYQRTFKFNTLASDVTISDGGYKISFNDSWDYSLGDGGNNIALTIPSGSSELTILVDEISGKVYDSVRTADFESVHNSGNKTREALKATISLIGSVREGVDEWTPAATGWEFTQISDTLYRYQKTFVNAGSYSYKCVFDYTDWYEIEGDQSITTTEANTSVIFLYDTVSQKLYDTINDATDVAVLLGMQSAPAEMEVIDNANGTTTFVALAEEGKEVTLWYGVKSEVMTSGTSALKSVEMTERENEAGAYESEALFLGDDALDYVYYYDVEGTRTLDGSNLTISVGGENYSNYTRAAFTGRIVTVPGSFPNAS